MIYWKFTYSRTQRALAVGVSATEYTVETYTVEKSYKLGFIEKYKGDVSISIMGEGIGILVMNNN